MNNGSDTQNDPPPIRLARVFEHATWTVIGALPLPVPNTLDARGARDLNAISQIAALVPANAAEVMVCVQIVATSAQGLECQRRAQHELDGNRFLRQAVQMFRVAQGAATMLLRLQAERRVREATPAAANSAMMTEHCAFALMAQALAAKAAAEREAAERAEAARAAIAAQQALPPPAPPPITEADIAAAEAYAQSNPSNLNRARIMRRKGGVPGYAMFTPPEENVVRAIALGHSPFLDALLPPGG